jgi:hypothetical protein
MDNESDNKAKETRAAVAKFMDIYNRQTQGGTSTNAGQLPPGVLAAYDQLTSAEKAAAIAMIGNTDDANQLRERGPQLANPDGGRSRRRGRKTAKKGGRRRKTSKARRH